MSLAMVLRRALRALPLLALALPAVARGQGESTIAEANTLVRARAERVTIPSGGRATARVRLEVAPGWHVNANPPALDYMIPTTVTITGAAGVTAGRAAYPPAKKQKLSFEESELLVYDGSAVVDVPLAATAGAATGDRRLQGEVHYQACNDQVCLAPVSVPFEIEVVVVAAPPGTAPAQGTPPRDSADTSAPATEGPPSSSGFTSGPPPGAGTPDTPVARGSFWGYVLLFLTGLGLNLTPCVYPMLGVTVSIFGARRQAPPLQGFGLALVYVLGIAAMYTSLGVTAAFTGGLFGGLLQNPWVLAGIGALLLVLSLSMFGLYDLQAPPELLSKLGGSGATNVAGIFFSGLVVGVFAAPCIGPPIVVLLTLVAQKQDLWYGFTTFFVLSLGLGLPYLVLGTFSNLLQTLPRSGEWMVWVKKVFGVVMLGTALFYGSLGLAPHLTNWVVPVTLVLGGLYLGFIERTTSPRLGFRRLKLATGVVAMLVGIVLVVPLFKARIVFKGYDANEIAGDLPRGRPVMLDFTASWCVPCHELEQATFTDRRVIAQARAFDVYRVDLTRYDSPEANAVRKQYGVTGVPTIVFLDDHAREVRHARVEGFLAPGPFLERMRAALGSKERAAAQ